MYTYIKQVIHIVVQQKLTPQCKPIVLQLKIKIKINKESQGYRPWEMG